MRKRSRGTAVNSLKMGKIIDTHNVGEHVPLALDLERLVHESVLHERRELTIGGVRDADVARPGVALHPGSNCTTDIQPSS